MKLLILGYKDVEPCWVYLRLSKMVLRRWVATPTGTLESSHYGGMKFNHVDAVDEACGQGTGPYTVCWTVKRKDHHAQRTGNTMWQSKKITMLRFKIVIYWNILKWFHQVCFLGWAQVSPGLSWVFRPERCGGHRCGSLLFLPNKYRPSHQGLRLIMFLLHKGCY